MDGTKSVLKDCELERAADSAWSVRGCTEQVALTALTETLPLNASLLQEQLDAHRWARLWARVGAARARNARGREADAEALHHDGITGTSVPAVVAMYLTDLDAVCVCVCVCVCLCT